MKKLDEIFNITYPSTMVLKDQVEDPCGVNFVSSKGLNNGVASRIAPTSKHTLYSAGAITVAMKGSVLSAFVQPEDFYIAHQIAVLYPKDAMTVSEKLFYCLCIEANRYRYNYGRQADRTLKELRVPDRNSVPSWVNVAFDEVVAETSSFLKSLA